MPVLRALLLVLLAGVAPALAAGPSEYQVKAVFLFNFAQFVVWPAQALGAADAPFSICIVGEDPFVAELDAAGCGESVQGHPFVIRRYRNSGDIETACHNVFMRASRLTPPEKLIKSLVEHATFS